MSTVKDNLSLPHLYGAPAHTPRRLSTDPVEAPLGPDDLPIERHRSAEDQALALQLFPRSYASQVMEAGARLDGTQRTATTARPQLNGRPLILRALAGRLMRPKGY